MSQPGAGRWASTGRRPVTLHVVADRDLFKSYVDRFDLPTGHREEICATPTGPINQMSLPAQPASSRPCSKATSSAWSLDVRNVLNLLGPGLGRGEGVHRR